MNLPDNAFHPGADVGDQTFIEGHLPRELETLGTGTSYHLRRPDKVVAVGRQEARDNPDGPYFVPTFVTTQNKPVVLTLLLFQPSKGLHIIGHLLSVMIGVVVPLVVVTCMPLLIVVPVVVVTFVSLWARAPLKAFGCPFRVSLMVLMPFTVAPDVPFAAQSQAERGEKERPQTPGQNGPPSAHSS
jgi:hypothetical protein